MKALFVVLFTVSFYVYASEAQLSNIKPVGKVPKSLFLIKKAKIDNDVGDPVLYPKGKQEQNIRNEKIFRKYNLSDTFENYEKNRN